MTYEELKQEGFVRLRDCSLCGSPLGHLIHPEFAAAVFQSGCLCVDDGSPTYRLITHEELERVKKP